MPLLQALIVREELALEFAATFALHPGIQLGLGRGES
jgi:hypothetical protein